MKFLYFGCLLLAIGRILAQETVPEEENKIPEEENNVPGEQNNAPGEENNADTDDSSNKGISEECLAEMMKYASCLAKFNILDSVNDLLNGENDDEEEESESVEIDEPDEPDENGGDSEDDESDDSLDVFSMVSKKSIQSYCTIMESDDCKAFLADISKPDTACLNKDSNSLPDFISGFVINALKVPYLMYCTKGDNGDFCPVSKYLQDHASELKDIGENISDVSITPEQLQTIGKDCSDSKCNSRMMTIYNFFDSLVDSIPNENSEDSEDSINPITPISEIFDVNTLIDYYKDSNKCAAIAGNSNNSPSSGSDTQNPSSSESDSGSLNNQEDAEGAAFNLQKITYTFIAMVLLSSILLF